MAVEAVFTKLVSRFLVYFGFRGLQMLAAFLLIPVLTHTLTQDDYGKVILFQSLVVILVPYVEIGHVLRRQYFQLTAPAFATALYGSIAIICLNGLILLLGMALIFRYTDTLLSFSFRWVICALVIAILTSSLNLASAIWLVMKRSWHYGIANLLFTAGQLLLTIALITALQMGWEASAIAMLSTAIFVGGGALFIACRPYHGLQESSHGFFLSNWKRQGLLMPYIICTGMYFYIGNVIMSTRLSLSDIALFGFGLQLGNMIRAYGEASVNALIPQLYNYLQQKTHADKKNLRIALLIWLAGQLAVCLILVSALPWILQWLAPPTYYGIIELFPWFAAAFFFQGITRLLHQYIFFFKNKQFLLSWATICSFLITVFMTIVLIDHYHMTGAAMSICIGSFIWMAASALTALYIRHTHKTLTTMS